MYTSEILDILLIHKEYEYITIQMQDGTTHHAKTEEINAILHENIISIQRPEEDYILILNTKQINKITLNKKRRGTI